MKSRVTLIIGLAHAVVLALLGLAALLLGTDWLEHPSLTGVRRDALAVYLIVNAVLLEVYIVGRNELPRLPLHFTAIHLGLSVNEVLLRSFALLNIGLAVGALLTAERDRWWLMALAALGIFAFRLSFDFPEEDRAREWTIGEIIRHYAQESERYLRWLTWMQYVYGAASILIWLVSLALLFMVIAVGANFAHAAFMAAPDPTWPHLGSTMLTAFEKAGAWIVRVVPIMGAFAVMIGLAAALFEAIRRWWAGPARLQDPLSGVMRRDLKARARSSERVPDRRPS